MKFTLFLFLLITIISCNSPTLELDKNNSTQINYIPEVDNKFPFTIEKFVFDKANDEINNPNSGYFQLIIEFTNKASSKIIDGDIKKI